MAYFNGLNDMFNISSPRDLLQNDWVVFSGVFLLAFAIVYFSIGRFFSSKKAATLEDLLRGKGDKFSAHPAAAVIALVIAFFTASAVVREDIVQKYFGSVLTIWIGVFVFIVLVILTIPFYKSLKNSLGNGKFATVFANCFLVLCFWASLKFLLPIESLYYIPYNLQDIYGWLISISGLIVLLVVGSILGLIFGKK
jgi:hypothetical protein